MTFRDHGTLLLVLVLPLVQLVLFTYAIHMDIRHIPLVTRTRAGTTPAPYWNNGKR